MTAARSILRLGGCIIVWFTASLSVVVVDGFRSRSRSPSIGRIRRSATAASLRTRASSTVLSMSPLSAAAASSSSSLASSSSDENTTGESKSKSTVHAILWDMDGVLAETERDGHRVAFNQIFEQYQLDTQWDVDHYGTLLAVGGGKERMTAYWNQVGWPQQTAFFGATSTEDEENAQQDRQTKVKELHEAKTKAFNTIIQAGTVPLRPGVARLMDAALAANIQLAVCSTSNEQAVQNLVQTLLGPDRAAQITIFAGDCVAHKKPAPDIYQLAVDTLDLDKTKCVIIEDSGIGFQAAQAAEIGCIVTTNTYTEHEDFHGADLIVPDLETGTAKQPVTLTTLEELLAIRNNKS